jgi:hypothetical protein
MRKLFIILLCGIFFSGCYETRRHGYTERRGLMLLEKCEYARNQGVYKPPKNYRKNISKKIRKAQNNKKTILNYNINAYLI